MLASAVMPATLAAMFLRPRNRAMAPRTRDVRDRLKASGAARPTRRAYSLSR